MTDLKQMSKLQLLSYMHDHGLASMLADFDHYSKHRDRAHILRDINALQSEKERMEVRNHAR